MHRPERLAEALKEVIAEVVGFELEDPRLETVTVTDVEVSADLRDARIYVLIDGSEDEIAAALATLKTATGFVRRQVAIDLSLRHVPHLHFARDTAAENAVRVGSILQTMEEAGELDEMKE
jgi:ribosome-binding factor A